MLYAYACCFGFFHFYIHVCRLFIINCFVIYTYVLKNAIHIYYNRLPIISIICSVSDKGTFSTSDLVIGSHSINTAIPKRACSRQIKNRSSLKGGLAEPINAVAVMEILSAVVCESGNVTSS